jgi:zinc protease
MSAERSWKRALAGAALALTLAACGAPPGPIVAPLRYGPVALAPNEPFRAQPPAWPATLPALALPYDITSLPNGLTVVHVPRNGLPRVSIRLEIARGRVDVGAPIDTASILERVLARDAGGGFGDAYARLGASPGFACTADGCTLSATVGSADLDGALRLLAETAIRPHFGAYEFSVVRERWMYDFVTSPLGTSSSWARNQAVLLFGRAHPRGFALFPSAHTRDLALNDVAALHAQLFRPAHATLIIVGDATKEAVAASAIKRFGAWSDALPAIPRPPPAPSEATPRRVVIVNHRGALQCSSWVGVAVPTTDDAELAAVAVLTRAVGGTSSTLREEVRDERGATYLFGDLIQPMRGVTVAGFFGELDREKAQDALKAIVAAVRKARSAGLPAADVALAQTNLIAEWQARAATFEGLSRLTAEAIEHDVPLASLAAFPARVAAVTPAAVQRAAQRYFSDAALRVVVVGDFRWIEDLDDLGLGDYQLRDGFADVAP